MVFAVIPYLEELPNEKTLSFIVAACLLCCCLCGAALAQTQDVYEEFDGILDAISGLDGDISTEQTALILGLVLGTLATALVLKKKTKA